MVMAFMVPIASFSSGACSMIRYCASTICSSALFECLKRIDSKLPPLTIMPFRLACLNGMIVSGGNFESIRLRHSKSALEQIVDAQYRIIEHAPELNDAIGTMKAITMKPEESEILAKAAIELRWPTEVREDETVVTTAPVTADTLLRSYRSADQG